MVGLWYIFGNTVKPPIENTQTSKDTLKVLLYTHSVENHLWKRIASTKDGPKGVLI